MQTALAASALLMGLAGGPHCAAMCGAACGGITRLAGGEAAAVPMVDARRGSAVPWRFHAGRVAGYAAAGAIAAVAVQGLALASEHAAALRPLWVLLHVAVLVWGVALGLLGRQPVWAHRAGRAVALRLRPLAGTGQGQFAVGAMWVALPCGMLYSALMLAGLANGPLEGAAVMALFALGSGVSLVLGPWLWLRLKGGAGMLREAWGTRLAGWLLAAVAVQAIWTDLARQIALWCG